MHEWREHRLRQMKQSRVTAVFGDRALSFVLDKGATLEELSDRLANLGRRHNGRPLAITVKFASSSYKAGSQAKPDPQTVNSCCKDQEDHSNATSQFLQGVAERLHSGERK